eukprot:GSChrysophyteH2.ASY1.ANO1.395.1 assembled CDS
MSLSLTLSLSLTHAHTHTHTHPLLPTGDGVARHHHRCECGPVHGGAAAGTASARLPAGRRVASASQSLHQPGSGARSVLSRGDTGQERQDGARDARQHPVRRQELQSQAVPLRLLHHTRHRHCDHGPEEGRRWGRRQLAAGGAVHSGQPCLRRRGGGHAE